MLETSFQRLTWSFQGCRFQVSCFQIDMINYLFTLKINERMPYESNIIESDYSHQ